jgi:membrane protease YdiL (CAAX protease family)
MRRQVFIVWFAIFLVWSAYRAHFFFPEWVDELVVKPLIFVLPVILIIRIREKGDFLSELGLKLTFRNFMLDFYIGAVMGVIFALEGLLANYYKNGQFSFTPIMALGLAGGILPFLGINLATSIWEEILGRGYLYNRLYKSDDHQFQSAFLSSFLFLLLHIPIIFTRLHLTGTSLIIYPVSILILGITNSYLFSLRGSLTLPILIHLFWNMTVALYL